MKKTVALVMAVCLLFGLTACTSGQTGGTAGQTAEQTEATQTEATQTTAEVPAGTTGDENESPAENRDETKDVVIVGAGITGLMAAMEFIEDYPDIDFVLLEQQGFMGGSAFFSEGLVLGFTDTTGADLTQFATPEQFAALFETSSRTAEEYGFEAPGYQVNKGLVNQVFGNMPLVYEYIQKAGGNIHYEDIPYYNENSYSDEIYCYPAEGAGAGLATAVANYVAENAGDVRLNSRVTELLSEGNKVTGVKVEDEEGSYTIKSDYVILATGGIGNNSEMIAEYSPAYVSCYVETNAGANGDGIVFTRQFDTPLVGDGMLGLISSDDESYALMASHFMVDREGQRFANETLNTYLLLIALMNNAGGEAWVIADYAYYKENQEKVDFKLDAGTVTVYETLDEVCEATGIDRDGLQTTIESYNQAAKDGKTAEFDLDAEQIHPIGEGPYYVEKASTYCFGSIRSIQINENLQVVNGNGEPVEGLYAGGELTLGNVINGQYSKSGMCVSYGSNSGVAAAKQIGSQYE